jgi:hypothetical protein
MQEVLMPTEGRPEPHAKNFGENIESDLALEFLRVVENAAVESARTMGQGDRPLSDLAATESMRKTSAMKRPCFISENRWAVRIWTVAQFLTLTSRSIR